ncbi:MAG: hypothetical protein JRJ02_12355 [Deltaproteobacteria bacterium]|nr:hypothetical protein [Deltaproteobacteria bacterium]
MKSLKQLCKPRSSVFDPSRRDTVLDITDLVEDHIDAQDFFEENYVTDGMRHLLRESFRRFERKSTQGVFVLTQAMGGGKTHNMIALGLLAKNPKLRPKVMGGDHESTAYAAALRVLTQYKGIEDFDIAHELSKRKVHGEKSPIELIIEDAVKIACDHLVPKGFDAYLWKTLIPEERLYLKGLDLEGHGEFRTGAYQELARGFGVREYTFFFAKTRANQTRFKTAREFGTKFLGGEGFGSSLVRNALFAVREAVRTEEAQTGKNWLKNEFNGYWDQRKNLITVLNYFGSMEYKSEHWKEDATAARLVSGAVENDHA